MSEIAEFLLARLAEDERVVRYASVNAHRPALHLDGNGYVVVDPTRVLAEVEAKRQIVALHKPRGRNILGRPVCAACSPLEPLPCPTLRLLALPYADHEHYRQEWRP